jgi:UDP-N-acetylenolpyruvoylglucosamine reductase
VNISKCINPQGFSDLMSVVKNIIDRVYVKFAITLEIEPRIYEELGHA